MELLFSRYLLRPYANIIIIIIIIVIIIIIKNVINIVIIMIITTLIIRTKICSSLKFRCIIKLCLD